VALRLCDSRMIGVPSKLLVRQLNCKLLPGMHRPLSFVGACGCGPSDNLNGTMCGDRPMRVRYDRFPQAPATAAKGSDESAPKGASRGDINVFVTDSAGTTVSLSVMPTGTVGDVLGVANGLKELRGGPRAGLVLDGVVLDPTSTLVDCAISDDTTLELVADTSAM